MTKWRCIEVVPVDVAPDGATFRFDQNRERIGTSGAATDGGTVMFELTASNRGGHRSSTAYTRWKIDCVAEGASSLPSAVRLTIPADGRLGSCAP